MIKEDYNKFYIQGSDHYLIPKDIFDELFNEMSNWKEEAKELKKQLEEANEKIILLQASKPMLEYKKALEKNQQKEFIKYMNDIIKELESEDVDDEELRGYMIQRIYTFKEILQKYKSIIGGKE